MKKLLSILFLFLFFAANAEKKDLVRYDTAKANAIRNATPEKEKEVFSDKDFQYHSEAKVSKNWLKAFLDWLTEKIFGKLSAENVTLTWKIVKWTLIALFIAGIIFVIWKSKFRGMLRGNPKSLSGAAFSDLPEDIESVNIDKLINDAVQAGNYRLAIRWCFLKSLQKLNEQKQIAWQPSKTNIDYQYELKNKDLSEGFGKLSYVFEYVWYGEMLTNESTFTKYKNETEKFNGSVHV